MSGEGEGAGGAEDRCGFAEGDDDDSGGDDDDDDVVALHTSATVEYHKLSLVKFPKSSPFFLHNAS